MFWILGCGLGSPVPSGATEVELQVHALGYVRDGEQAVIEMQGEAHDWSEPEPAESL